MKINFIGLLPLLFCFFAWSNPIQEMRRQLIFEALNSRPQNWIEPIKLEDIQMGQYEARIVVNQKSKFTYYLHIPNVVDSNSQMVLIPMSTSRYTPTYYQTDEWWDQHKGEIDKAKREGLPMPKQDMNEVKVWLEEMKLSTNPDVFVISPGTEPFYKTEPLQKYLLDIFLKYFVEDGKVILYRGAEKPNELESWKNGQVPRGVRYWTPTANYAWRYGRKNREFLDLLLKGETPLFRFEIPVQDFIQMNQRRWPRLTFGTELTKNAHQIFDRSGYFGDHLYNGLPFLGWGAMGVEIEVRSNRRGAQMMVQYFKRAATVEDLVQDRLRVLQAVADRLGLQMPEPSKELSHDFQQRIEKTQIEGEILLALREGVSLETVEPLLKKLNSSQAELGYIDGVNFSSWARNKAQQNSIISCKEILK